MMGRKVEEPEGAGGALRRGGYEGHGVCAVRSASWISPHVHVFKYMSHMKNLLRSFLFFSFSFPFIFSFSFFPFPFFFPPGVCVRVGHISTLYVSSDILGMIRSLRRCIPAMACPGVRSYHFHQPHPPRYLPIDKYVPHFQIYYDQRSSPNLHLHTRYLS